MTTLLLLSSAYSATPQQLALPGKRGACWTLRDPRQSQIGTWEQNLPKLAKVQPYWNYSWGADSWPQQTNYITSEFVPMIWGKPKSAEDLRKTFQEKVVPHIKDGTVKRVLGFNEPDKKDQSNMPYMDAIELWPEFMKLGVPLCSPACANPVGINDESAQNVPGSWMRDFMREADKRGYRVDYIGAHWYGGTSVESFKERMRKIYEMYGRRPLLITEFAPADWQVGGDIKKNRHTPAAVLKFMKEVLPWLEAQDWIAGYAWFSFNITSPQGWSSALLDEAGNLTACGRYYRSVTRENPRGDQTIEPDPVTPVEPRQHGLVGLRPLPRTTADHQSNHGGSWAGTPTFEEQKGKYPFVAEHLDVVKGWLDGDFKTKRVFFEYYWGLSAKRDDLEPTRNFLIKTIRDWESQGATVEHILICREYRLAIQRGHEDAQPGPFKEDTRILSAQDVDDIHAMFRKAHELGLLKYDNYKLIQMVEEPSFFADDARVKPIIAKMEGVAYECHQFNRHWPLETGWSKPEKVVRGAKWTLAQGKEYIFYYGPIIWKSEQYYEFIERDWLNTYWKAGLPKHHPKMHYYLNTFPNGTGRGRPVGPESDPHSVLGFTKWLIQEIKPETNAQ